MISWFITAATIFGHLAIACAIFNQVHATRLKQGSRGLVEKLFYVLVAIVLLWILLHSWGYESVWLAQGFKWYQFVCLVVAALISARWLYWQLFTRRPDAIHHHTANRIDFAKLISGNGYHGLQGSLLRLVPGNQSLQVAVEQLELQLPQWPSKWQGLRIAQISDLHLTGKIDKKFFELACEECNRHEPDLVVLTGDVVDYPDCIPWLPDTLGRLKATIGKFYILGNHDQRCDEKALRESIEQTGFQRLTGQWHAVEHEGRRLWLAGNEMPWFPGGFDLRPRTTPADEPRILLSHTPDHIQWARAMEFDLMFAGHTHGGQIQFPLIGPVITPSRYGVRYASGTFQQGKMLMHVSRGLSGDDPIRWNCPPEIGIFSVGQAD